MTLGHEKLEVYRLSLGYVAWVYAKARSLTGVHRPARDQWLRASQSMVREEQAEWGYAMGDFEFDTDTDFDLDPGYEVPRKLDRARFPILSSARLIEVAWRMLQRTMRVDSL